MKKIEFLLILLSIVLIIMKVLALPWSGILLGITLFLLACFYYFLSFALFNKISLKGIFNKSSYKNISARRLIFAIGIGWALSITILGSLFKLEVLPYSSYILLFGVIAIGITSFISLLLKYQTKSKYFNQILLRNLIIGGIGLFLFFIN